MIARNWMARNVYYPYDFEAHKNLSHKQFPIEVYYFMNGALLDQYETIVFVVGFLRNIQKSQNGVS